MNALYLRDKQIGGAAMDIRQFVGSLPGRVLTAMRDFGAHNYIIPPPELGVLKVSSSEEIVFR